MGKRGPKGYTETKIVEVLRAVEAVRAAGSTIKEAVLDQGVSEQTYFSQRRACKTLGVSRTTHRYKSVASDDTDLIRLGHRLRAGSKSGR